MGHEIVLSSKSWFTLSVRTSEVFLCFGAIDFLLYFV